MSLEIPSDDYLARPENHWDFGTASIEFLPKQWEFCFAPETDLCFRGGFGCSKTKAAIYRATRLSCFYPGNQGIVGRFAATDLAATTRLDCLEFWREAGLLADFKEKTNGVPTAVLHCLDRHTNQKINKTSRVLFLHVDDPGHLHGYQVGWFWVDEAQEATVHAWRKLVGRCRLPGFERVYSHFLTANANGHDWIWNTFVNPLMLAKLTADQSKRRRYIHGTTYENKFLAPDYIANMKANYSVEDVKRYLEASDDIFEGQIYKEFSHAIHVVAMEQCTFRSEIPTTWDRYLAVDVGGSDPWAWIFAAIDPQGNIIIYDEIYAAGTRVAPFAERASKRLRPELHFRKKVIDFENKLAAGELGELGIKFTNAQKQNKRDSIFRLSGYLHASEERRFPEWHQRAGEAGAPRLYITANCRHLIAELPQQRWKQIRGSDSWENVADDAIANHAVDAALYIVRELPKPTELPQEPFANLRVKPTDLNSTLRWHDRLERKKQEHRARWNSAMCGGHGVGRRVHL